MDPDQLDLGGGFNCFTIFGTMNPHDGHDVPIIQSGGSNPDLSDR